MELKEYSRKGLFEYILLPIYICAPIALLFYFLQWGILTLIVSGLGITIFIFDLNRKIKLKRIFKNALVEDLPVKLNKYLIRNKKDFTLRSLDSINKSNQILSELENIVNRDIFDKIVDRSQVNIIDETIPNRKGWVWKSSLLNLTNCEFVLRDLDDDSPFYFALKSFHIPTKKMNLYRDRDVNESFLNNSKYNKDLKEEISFNIALMPDSIDNLEVKHYRNIDYKEMLQLYTQWKMIVFLYDNFSIDESDKQKTQYAEKYNVNQILLLEKFLDALTVKIESERNEENAGKVNEVIQNIKKIKKNLNQKNKGEIKKMLRRLREKLLWLSKDIIWDLVKEIAFDNFPFLN